MDWRWACTRLMFCSIPPAAPRVFRCHPFWSAELDRLLRLRQGSLVFLSLSLYLCLPFIISVDSRLHCLCRHISLHGKIMRCCLLCPCCVVDINPDLLSVPVVAEGQGQYACWWWLMARMRAHRELVRICLLLTAVAGVAEADAEEQPSGDAEYKKRL